MSTCTPCDTFVPATPGTVWGGTKCKTCGMKKKDHKKKVEKKVEKKKLFRWNSKNRIRSGSVHKKAAPKVEEKKKEPEGPKLTKEQQEKAKELHIIATLFDWHKQNKKHHGEDGDYSLWFMDKILTLQRHFRQRQAKNPHLIQEEYAAFCEATDFMPIMTHFHKLYELAVPPAVHPGDKSYIYLRDRTGVNFKTKKLWKMMGDLKANDWFKSRPGLGRKAVVVGAGPAGLRMACELRLSGFDVTVLEKRDNFARYNVLHIWDTTAADFLTLGVKFFDPLFGAGSLQTVPIRVVQQLLLKVALVLGCKVLVGAFTGINKPNPSSEVEAERKSYSITADIRTKFDDQKSVVTKIFPCEILIGSDGAGSHVAQPAGFERKMSSGSLALGFTCNFENHQSRKERNLKQMKKAYQFEQKFFDNIDKKTGCFLENLVYFRCPTNHYFVMCPRKKGLLKTGVLKKKLHGPELTARANVDRAAFMKLARAIATVCGIPESCDFCRRANGSEDIALFDFSRRVMSEQAMTYHVWSPESDSAPKETPQAEVVGDGKEKVTMLCALVGDALLEPFWPQGTGLNKALLACVDTAWFLKKYYALPTDSKWDDHLKSMDRLFEERARNLQYMHSATPNDLQAMWSDKRQIAKLKKAQHGTFCDPKNRYKKSAPVLSRSNSRSRSGTLLSRGNSSSNLSKGHSRHGSLGGRNRCATIHKGQLPSVKDEAKTPAIDEIEGELDLSALRPPHFEGVPESGHFWFRPSYANITHPKPVL